MKKLKIFGIIFIIAGVLAGAGSLALGATTVGEWEKAGNNAAKKLGWTEPVLVETEFDTAEVREISGDLLSRNLKIVRTERDNVYVSAYSRFENQFSFTENDGKLTVKENRQDGILQWFYPGFVDLCEHITGNYDTYNTVLIEMPEDFAPGLDVDIASGKAEFSGEFKDIRIDVSSGTVQADNISALEVKIGVSSGSVSFNKIDCSALNISISSGSVFAENIEADTIKVNCSSGSVRLLKAKAEGITASLSSGSCRISTVDALENYRIKIDVSSGSVRLDGNKVNDNYRANESAEKYIEAKVSSGSLRIYAE